MLVNRSHNHRRRRAQHRLHLLPILKIHKRRHGRNAQLLRYIGRLINVDFVKLDVGVFVAVFFDFGRDGLARGTPGGVAVDDDEFGGVLDGGFEFVEAGERE